MSREQRGVQRVLPGQLGSVPARRAGWHRRPAAGRGTGRRGVRPRLGGVAEGQPPPRPTGVGGADGRRIPGRRGCRGGRDRRRDRRPRAGRPAAPGGAPPAHLAAFSVTSNPDGTTTLAVSASGLLDPGPVRRALAAHGIPALVTDGSYCSSSPAPAGFTQVVQIVRAPARAGTEPARPGRALPSDAPCGAGDQRLGDAGRDRAQHRVLRRPAASSPRSRSSTGAPTRAPRRGPLRRRPAA